MNEFKSIIKLSNLSIISANGKDAIAFLNNQFTNDIETLSGDQWQFNGYCTAKGRLIAIMRLFKVNDTVFMITQSSIAQTLVDRLKIYVFRAKVTFEILNVYECYALFNNKNNNENTTDQSIKPHSKPLKTYEDGFELSLNSTNNKQLLITQSEPNIDHVSIISGDKADKQWRMSQINQGIPTIYPQTIEKLIPQHINFDEIDGVSFKKGCFPGQEIVARLHYLGKSKQSMKMITLTSKVALHPGDSIIYPKIQKPVTIVDAVNTSAEVFSCLAVGQFN